MSIQRMAQRCTLHWTNVTAEKMLVRPRTTPFPLLLLFLWAGVLVQTTAQKRQLTGFVTDFETGEVIIGASIVIEPSNQGATTNKYGYFSIRFPAGGRQFVVTSVGYQPYQSGDVAVIDSVIAVKLIPRIIQLNEATVKTDQTDDRYLSPGRVNIPISQLKKVPTLLGESDIMKALALTPGVNTGTEGTSGLLVRGGTPDQNLILLDGAPVYNVSHLFGLVSVFNADAIKNVDLYKGGFPARYGGRLSSVIDITMREGNNQKRSMEGGIGLVGARLIIEGPTHKKLKGKSSFLLAGRTSYLGLFMLPSRIAFNKGRIDQYFNYTLYDFNGKINYTLGKNSRLFASFYTGNDRYLSQEGIGTSRQSFSLNWGNTTATVRYNRAINATLFHETVMLYTEYRYAITNQFLERVDGKLVLATDYNVQSALRDWTMKNQWIYSGLQNHTVRFGIDLSNHRFTPIAPRISHALSADTSANAGRSFWANEAAGYVEDEFKPFPTLTINAGLRGVAYVVNKTTFTALEPRLSISKTLGSTLIAEAGYSRMNQFVHLLSSSGVGLPNDVWLPVTKRLPPSSSDQVMLGIKARWPSAGWLLTGDIYYKSSKRLTDYQVGSNFLANFNSNWEDQIETGGRGTTTGMEWMIRKTKGKFTGWVAYTLSRNTRVFSTINESRPYAAPYDRRHVASLFLDYTSKRGMGLSATWQYHSGDPTTVPVAVRENFGTEQPVLLYGDKNNFRMPAYHRLDIVARFVRKRNSGRISTWTTGFYNIYNRANPLYLDIKRGYVSDSNGSSRFPKFTGTQYRLVIASSFPIFPVVSYSFTY